MIEWTFKREDTLYLKVAYNDRYAFYTPLDHRPYKLGTCQKVRDALSYPLGDIYIGFCTKLHKQIVGIPIGTNCAPLKPICFYFAMKAISLFDDNQADIIESFISTSRYPGDLLNIDNHHFEGMVHQAEYMVHNMVHQIKLQLNKANASVTPFWIYIYLFLIVFSSSKTYDNSEDFDFYIVDFPFVDGDVLRRISYGVNIL